MLIEALGVDRSQVISLCGAGGKTTLMFALARELIARGERVLLTTTTQIASDEAAGPWASFAATDVDRVLEGARRLLPAAAGAVIAYSAVSHDRSKLVGFAPDVIDRVSGSRELDRILVEADGAARKPLKAPAAHEPVIPSSTDALIVVSGLNGVGQALRDDHVFHPEMWARLTGVARDSLVTARSLAQVVIHPDGLGKGSPPGALQTLFLNRADTPERRGAATRVVEFLAASGCSRLSRVVTGCLLPEPRVATIVVLSTCERRSQP